LWILSNRETLTKVCSGLILPFFGLVSVAEKEVRAVTDVVTAKQECGTVMDIKTAKHKAMAGAGAGAFLFPHLFQCGSGGQPGFNVLSGRA
jgi:hypothetical protein